MCSELRIVVFFHCICCQRELLFLQLLLGKLHIWSIIRLLIQSVYLIEYSIKLESLMKLILSHEQTCGLMDKYNHNGFHTKLGIELIHRIYTFKFIYIYTERESAILIKIEHLFSLKTLKTSKVMLQSQDISIFTAL